jgi:hypothetical protein
MRREPFSSNPNQAEEESPMKSPHPTSSCHLMPSVSNHSRGLKTGRRFSVVSLAARGHHRSKPTSKIDSSTLFLFRSLQSFPFMSSSSKVKRVKDLSGQGWVVDNFWGVQADTRFRSTKLDFSVLLVKCGVHYQQTDDRRLVERLKLRLQGFMGFNIAVN